MRPLLMHAIFAQRRLHCLASLETPTQIRILGVVDISISANRLQIREDLRDRAAENAEPFTIHHDQ
jgi:hypothetical protein